MRQLKITQSITHRDEPSLNRYFHDISKEELITPEEEVELSNRITNGDDKALDKLARANLRFVISVAKQYQNKGLSMPDMINEGNLGLIIAAKKFDPTKGFRFISYAVWWIRQSIMQAIIEQSRIIRLPLNQIGMINKINNAISGFEQENDRKPSIEELSSILDVSQEVISRVLELVKKPFSFDEPLIFEEDSKLIDIVENRELPATDNELTKQSLGQEIEQALNTLSDRESEIIRYFYGLETRALSLHEIGDKLGLSRERIRQIKERAIKKLRSSPKAKFLKTYLG
ncbi:RNA polymerase sigma factor SigA [subsurface metagenome]